MALRTQKCKDLVTELQVKGYLPLTYSDRNKKLVPSKDLGFLIWNLPAVMTCPYATLHCKEACYAKKAEKAYPDCLPSRMDHFQESRQADFRYRMLLTILLRRQNMRKRFLVVRIHESGDFYNMKYTADWLWIMDQCEGESITFIAYTKSFRFFDGLTLPRAFFLRASLWDDTSKDQREIIARNGWNIYTAVEKFTDHDDFHQCRCDDCATCQECWRNDSKVICCEIH